MRSLEETKEDLEAAAWSAWVEAKAEAKAVKAHAAWREAAEAAAWSAWVAAKAEVKAHASALDEKEARK